MPSIQIRTANEQDTHAILRLLRQIGSVVATNTDVDMSDEELLGIVRDCTTFLIEQDGPIIGMNAVRIVDVSGQRNARFRKFAFIMAIGVDEAKRRQGHGTALVNHMLEWLPQQGVDMVCLNVSAQNIAAQSFYQRTGFGTTSMQMSRLLSDPHGRPKTMAPKS